MNESPATYSFTVLIVLSIVVMGAAVFLWVLKRSTPFYRSLATAIMLTGFIGTCEGLGFLDPGRRVLWKVSVVLGQLFQPAAMLYICISLMDSSKSEVIRSARWLARLMGGVGGVLAVLLIGLQFVRLASPVGNLAEVLNSRIESHVVTGFLIIGFVFVLAYVEQSLRLLRNPLRYRLKFILIGLGALASVQIYHASQLVGVSMADISTGLLSGFGSLLALGLILIGLLRTRLGEAPASLYVAPSLVYGSATFLIVGLYLIGVGLVGELIRYSGLPLSEVLGGLVMLVAVMAALVLAVSRSIRVRVNRWIARLVYQAKYDYRAKWLEVTDAFQDCHTTDAVLDRVIDLLSRTFGAPRISVWMSVESDQRCHMVRSTVFEAGEASLPSDHPVVARLRTSDEVLDVGHMVFSDTADDHRFRSVTRVELCVPIQSSGRLLGFIAVGRDERGERYRHDDHQLLRVMAHHVGMLLVLSQQTEERRVSMELEALHRFSAFCLHDLKNLTAGLSLVVQNAIVHGQDPAFQQTVMKTVVGTVRKMTALMEKLSLKTRHEGSWQTVDVRGIIRDVVDSVKLPVRVDLNRLDGQPSLVRAVPEEFQQVLMNILLNARQAAGERGIVSIQIEGDGRVVRLQIVDNGPGIPPDRLRKLFQPFQTTKVGGLGIGLYQCKQIVESHQGTIRISSREGEGTTVWVTLPVAGGASTLSCASVEGAQTSGTEGASVHGLSGVSASREEMHHAG